MGFSRFLCAVAAWLALAGLPALTAAQTISQTTDSSAGLTGNVGQSFVATLTGNVVAIDVRSAFGGNVPLHFYSGGSGSGVSGGLGAPALTIPSATLTASASGGPFSHITLTTPFPVIAGQTYSFVVQGASLYSRFTDPYAGGMAFVNWADPMATHDLAFQVFEVAAAVPAPVPTAVPALSPAALAGLAAVLLALALKVRRRRSE